MDEKVKQIYESVKVKYEEGYDPSYECSFSDYVYISSLTDQYIDQYITSTGLAEDIEWSASDSGYTINYDPSTFTYGNGSVADIVARVDMPDDTTTYTAPITNGTVSISATDTIGINPTGNSTIAANTQYQHYERMRDFTAQLREILGVEHRVDWGEQIIEWAQDYVSAVKRDAEQAERRARQQDWIQELYKIAEVNAQIRAETQTESGDKHDEAYTNAMKVL